MNEPSVLLICMHSDKKEQINTCQESERGKKSKRGVEEKIESERDVRVIDD
jgi:hypothetical protein